MPFANEHALRLRQPKLFNPDSFRRTKNGTLFGGSLKVPDSISIIWGKLQGKAGSDDPVIAQALRFDKSRWTPTAAKSWIDKNIKRGIFEPATATNNTENITDKDLALAIVQGDLAEYNAGESVPIADIEAMLTTIEFSDNDDIDDTSLLTAQLHQLSADITQEDVQTVSTSAASESLAEEDSDEPETQNLKDIEIFQTGTWKDVPYTNDDLDEIAANFIKLREQIKPPVKLGHNDEQELVKTDGMPAAGWITNLKRVGDKLVADLNDVPRKIAKIIKNRGYKRVSSEIYTNFQNSQGMKFGKVFKALSLLGGDIPHLKSLDDIVAQYDGSLLDNEYRSVVIMAEDLKKEVTEDEVVEEETTDETIQEETTDESKEEVKEEVEEEKTEEHAETTNDTSVMEAKLAEQSKLIKQLSDKDAIRDQVIAKMQANLKAEKDEKNLMADESFLSGLTKTGQFPPSMRPKALALMTELRTSEEKLVTYTEEGSDAPVETNSLELIKKLFSEWPKGMDLKEKAQGAEVVSPGSGVATTVDKNGIPVYGEDIAEKITKYMEEHEGVDYGEAYAIVDAQMSS